MRTRRVTSGPVIGNVSVSPSWHPTVYKPIVPRLFIFRSMASRGVDRGSQPRIGKLPVQHP